MGIIETESLPDSHRGNRERDEAKRKGQHVGILYSMKCAVDRSCSWIYRRMSAAKILLLIDGSERVVRKRMEQTKVVLVWMYITEDVNCWNGGKQYIGVGFAIPMGLLLTKTDGLGHHTSTADSLS